jgi:hypothetical protein
MTVRPPHPSLPHNMEEGKGEGGETDVRSPGDSRQEGGRQFPTVR